MSPVAQCIDIMGITITFFPKSQEFGRRFPIHSPGYIFNCGCATAPAYVQPEELFTLLSSFSPLLSLSVLLALKNSAFSANS